MPRFVLLFHDCPSDYERPSHWDLMFESEGALRTWALVQLPESWYAWHRETADCGISASQFPALAESDYVPAEELPAHRPAYLDKEGPIDENRGTVFQVAAGSYELLAESPLTWEMELASSEVHGRLLLSRGDPSQSRWKLSYSTTSD